MIFDFPPEYQRAIRIAAAEHGIKPTPLMMGVIETAFAQQLEKARKLLAAEESKRGRPKP